MSLRFKINYQNTYINNKFDLNRLVVLVSKNASNLFKIKNPLYFDISVCDSKHMLLINRKYRHINASTDVLSFALHDVPPRTPLLGDIFINWDDVRKQSTLNKTTLEKEFIILFIHGLFHLLGFDHNSSKNQIKMDKTQAKIMSKLNY